MMFTTPLGTSHPSVRGAAGRGDAREGSRALAADELNVFGHDGDALGVDGAQVGVLEEADQVRLGRLLQRQDGVRLEKQVRLEVLRDLADQALERQLRISSSVDFWYFCERAKTKGERGVERGGTRCQRKTREKETLNLRLRFAQFDVRREGAIEAPLA